MLLPQVFLPREADQQNKAKALIASTAEELGYTILGWRALPTESTGVGRSALAVEPAMFQMFLVATDKAMFASLELEQQVRCRREHLTCAVLVDI